MHEAEKTWVKSRNVKSLIYVSGRKLSDMNVQMYKRQYWYKLQTDLVPDAENIFIKYWKIRC